MRRDQLNPSLGVVAPSSDICLSQEKGLFGICYSMGCGSQRPCLWCLRLSFSFCRSLSWQVAREQQRLAPILLLRATSTEKDLLHHDEPLLLSRKEQKLGRVQAEGRQFLCRNMRKGSNNKTRQVS